MARIEFKTFMNQWVTQNTYHFYERGAFALLAGIHILLVVFLHQPTKEIVLVQEFDNSIILYMSWALVILGAYFFTQTMIDMLYCDIFGFDH